MARPLGNKRVFDGKTYAYHSRMWTKKDAEKSKDWLKKRGFNARVTKRMEKRLGRLGIKYEVWKRKTR